MKTEPQTICEEIHAAMAFVKKVTHPLQEIADQYHGSHSGPNPTVNQYDLENHVFEYVTLLLPMAFDMPRIDVGADLGGEVMDLASGLKHAGNSWLRQGEGRSRIMKAALDCLLLYGVIMTTIEPQPGYEQDYANGEDDVPMWPKWTRLPQRWHFWDPRAMEWDEVRYEGHLIHTERDDLIRRAKAHPEEGWILEAVEAACGNPDAGLAELPTSDYPDRGEFVYYEYWMPHVQVDPKKGPRQGYNGTIYTVCMAISTSRGSAGYVDKSYQIREPRPYFGPRWGPYTKIGVYPMLNQAVSMSPVQAVMRQVKELNDQAEATNRSAKSYKKLVLCDSANTKLAASIANDPHMFVIPIEGLQRDQVLEIEIGGISDQQLRMLMEARNRLDRISGMSDAVRGNAQTGTTATADAIAAQSSQSKIGLVRREFQNGITQAIRTAVWFMFAEERFKIVLSPEAAEQLVGQPATVEYHGGDLGSEDDQDGVIDPAWFDRLGFEIQAYSMDRTDEMGQQRNAMLAFQLVSQAAPFIRAYPELDWKRILSLLGDGINVPGFGDLIDLELAEQIGAMQGLIAPGMEANHGQAGQAIGTAALFGPNQRNTVPGGGGGGGLGPQRPVAGSSSGSTAAQAVR